MPIGVVGTARGVVIVVVVVVVVIVVVVVVVIIIIVVVVVVVVAVDAIALETRSTANELRRLGDQSRRTGWIRSRITN